MPIKTTSPIDRIEDTRPGGSFRERDGQESQHSYANDHHKYMWLPAGSFLRLATAAAITENLHNALGQWNFVEAGSTGLETIACAVWRPKKWINGNIQLEYIFSQTTTDAVNTVIRAAYKVSSWSVGDTIAGTFDKLDVTESTTIGGTANVVQKVTKTTTTTVTSKDEYLGILYGRDAGHGDDTYGANIRFYGVLLTYLPTNRQ
jgi:hypothetical protein